MAYKKKKLEYGAHHFDMLPLFASLPPENAGRIFVAAQIDAARYAGYEGMIPEPPQVPQDAMPIFYAVQARMHGVIDYYMSRNQQNSENRNSGADDGRQRSTMVDDGRQRSTTVDNIINKSKANTIQESISKASNAHTAAQTITNEQREKDIFLDSHNAVTLPLADGSEWTLSEQAREEFAEGFPDADINDVLRRIRAWIEKSNARIKAEKVPDLIRTFAQDKRSKPSFNTFENHNYDWDTLENELLEAQRRNQ